MALNAIEFEIYRLNVIDHGDLLPIMGRPIAGDGDILRIIELSTNADLDQTTERKGSTHVYLWSLRGYVQYDNDELSPEPICGVSFGKAVVRQTGTIVTDAGFELGTATTDQPIGVAVRLIFFMERHLVAVEHRSAVMNTQAWRASLHAILDAAAAALAITSNLRLEPIARDAEVLTTFFSFALLTRLRVHLRIPNPDLTRHMKSLYDAMQEGEIRDFLQDMKNRNGLSQVEGRLPHAAATMADAGYKDGVVTMEGEVGGKAMKIITGKSAERISVEETEDLKIVMAFTRGAEAMAKRAGEKKAIGVILAFIREKLEPPRDGT